MSPTAIIIRSIVFFCTVIPVVDIDYSSFVSRCLSFKYPSNNRYLIHAFSLAVHQLRTFAVRCGQYLQTLPEFQTLAQQHFFGWQLHAGSPKRTEFLADVLDLSFAKESSKSKVSGPSHIEIAGGSDSFGPLTLQRTSSHDERIQTVPRLPMSPVDLLYSALLAARSGLLPIRFSCLVQHCQAQADSKEQLP